MIEELYDVGSASEKIGISFMTLRRWLEANEVEYSFKYKNHILFSESDIQKIIDSKKKKKHDSKKEIKVEVKKQEFSEFTLEDIM